jgi:hypothetical protein
MDNTISPHVRYWKEEGDYGYPYVYQLILIIGLIFFFFDFHAFRHMHNDEWPIKLFRAEDMYPHKNFAYCRLTIDF